MQLQSPFVIGPRLLPSLVIDDGTLSLEYVRTDRDGRDVYRWYVDIPAGEFSAADIRSGCQGGSVQEMFRSLLSFLSAAGESLRYCEGQRREPDDDDNASMFPRPVTEWARYNSDELGMLAIEIDETPDLIVE